MSEITQIQVGSNTYDIKDGGISSWARAANKPIYTASEVGALPSSTVIPNITHGTSLPSTLANGAIFLLHS